MATYSFVPSLNKAKFCGVSCVIEKLMCAVGEKRLWNTSTTINGCFRSHCRVYSSLTFLESMAEAGKYRNRWRKKRGRNFHENYDHSFCAYF
jgi:hypothetical protein